MSSAEKPAPETVIAPGGKGEWVRELQARLAPADSFDVRPSETHSSFTGSAVKGFQSGRGLLASGSIGTATWQWLLGMTKKSTRDEFAGMDAERSRAKPDERCMRGRVICVSKITRTLSWIIDGRVKFSMDVRFGSRRTPTREGVFNVFWKSRDHVSTIYRTPMPYAMFFSGGQAVHYSSDFAARGYNGASHGCINVRDKAAMASLFDDVRTGDRVVVYG
ncbi:L,D-transpeptidase family protein [Streptomyces sp. NPDC055709]